eukprot:gene10463-11593_t
MRLLLLSLLALLWAGAVTCYSWSPFAVQPRQRASTALSASLQSSVVSSSHYEDVFPYLCEHLQRTDQLLIVGAKNDLALNLALDGFGTHKTGFVLVVDDSLQHVEECLRLAQADDQLRGQWQERRLQFQHVSDLRHLDEVCKQSVFDSILDNQGLDPLLRQKDGRKAMALAVEHLQNSLRVGNCMVCLSTLGKEDYCPAFEEGFGWVQELDGEPGEVSAWYREKGLTNLPGHVSNFKDLGLKMYAFTNTFNC